MMSTTQRFLVAVVGNASVTPGSPRERLAEEVRRRVVDASRRLVTGGLGGVMAAASRGARRSGAWTDGTIIGVLPGTDPSQANPWVDVPLCTGLDHGRSRIVAQSDTAMAIGGGAGTPTELAFAWIHLLDWP